MFDKKYLPNNNMIFVVSQIRAFPTLRLYLHLGISKPKHSDLLVSPFI